MTHQQDTDIEPLTLSQMLLVSGVTILTITITIVALQLAQSGGFTTQRNDATSPQSTTNVQVKL